MDIADIGTLAWARRTGGRVDAAEREAIQKATVNALAAAAAKADRDVRDVLRPVDLDAVTVPDTATVLEAVEYVESVSPRFLVDHCYRTFFWGQLLAQADGVTLDDTEALFLASILHDLGCVEAHNHRTPGVHCFAVEGGLAAETFLAGKGVGHARVASISEAIVLHVNGWGVDGRFDTTARYLDAGAACDVTGRRSATIPAADARRVLDRHPGGGFGERFLDFLQKETADRPDSRMAIIFQSAAAAGVPVTKVFPWE